MKCSLLAILAVAAISVCSEGASATPAASDFRVPTSDFRVTNVSYIELVSLKANVPNDTLVQTLDDNGDGAVDNDIWTEIQTRVGEEIDGILGQRYTTPFTDPIPPLVRLAARTLAIEAVYDRRNLLNEKSPERINAKNIRAKLSLVAAGTEPLTPGKERARPSGSVIAEPSRTFNDRPAI